MGGSVRSVNLSKSGMDEILSMSAKAEEEAIAREAEAAQQRAETEASQKAGGREIKLVAFPTYKMDERLGCFRECDQPDTILFEELGWDRTPGENEPGEGQKHYRKFVPKELEKEKKIMSRPSEFNCYELTRG